MVENCFLLIHSIIRSKEGLDNLAPLTFLSVKSSYSPHFVRSQCSLRALIWASNPECWSAVETRALSAIFFVIGFFPFSNLWARSVAPMTSRVERQTWISPVSRTSQLMKDLGLKTQDGFSKMEIESKWGPFGARNSALMCSTVSECVGHVICKSMKS